MAPQLLLPRQEQGEGRHDEYGNGCTGRGTGVPRWLRDNGLTIVLLLLFALSFVGHGFSGWKVANHDALRHGARSMRPLEYAASPEFLATVFENWENEFLQMAIYVVLTAMLFQRGSPESKAVAAPRAQTGI